jgi:hypothetical protein
LHFCLVKCMAEISIRDTVLRCSGSFINWILVCSCAVLIPFILSF